MTPEACPAAGRVLAISGGIGGAKLALGLYRALAPQSLIVLANTGDDFEHLGLHISPDLDTLMYTLAGINNPELGWGRDEETWTFMRALGELGGETWFRLGDGDLATSIERTRRLAGGETLSEITDDFAGRLGVRAQLWPMSDDAVRTRVETAGQELAFQHYFVRERCAPAVTGFRFEGAECARPSPRLMRALGSSGLRAVVICPSNPFISVDPILAVPGVRAALSSCAAPVIAVSPVVGGRALKGPTDKMMRELGIEIGPTAIAARYRDLIDGFVLDLEDEAARQRCGVPSLCARIVMRTLADRERLAREVLRFADSLDSRTVG